jgi:transglutaminase-like putative cysteine protease
MSVLRHWQRRLPLQEHLLVALLRSLGIPSRMRFVTLKADFLHGIIDTGGHR